MNPALSLWMNLALFPLVFGTIYSFITSVTLNQKKFLFLLGLWAAFMAFVNLAGYQLAPPNTERISPIFATLPIGVAIAIFLFIKHKDPLIQSLNPERLTYLHSVRLFVELLFYELYLSGQIPLIMTFEGRNPDILVGLTAPLIGYFGCRKGLIPKGGILVWNLLSLLCLLNIVSHAVLSTITPFQQFGLTQPNVALFVLPWYWLPTILVPLVMFSQLLLIFYYTKQMKLKQ